MNKLFNLIEEVRAKMDKKMSKKNGVPQPAKVDLRQCTWSQVMDEVQSLATRWSATSKKSSRVRSCLDKMGRNSEVFKSWLELLPAGDYGSRYLSSTHSLPRSKLIRHLAYVVSSPLPLE